jgi:hypothetical protein
MRRILAALAASLLVVPVAAPAPLAAQGAAADGWNDARTLALVARATERRAAQLADTALRDYAALARGYVTFLAQLGEGFPEPPRVVKADQLALEVYWKAPDLSKQRIIGRRDTLLLPTDISYHRDHLGIVQNNFPSIIRLGEGDEVRDVPHPLSEAGLREYDFAVRDSLSIRLPGRSADVYEVRVRPRDDRQPRVVGAVYLDRATGEVVRMAFNFTRAAYIDRNLEDLAIVLENALVENRFWLPWRQEIEIRRTATWLDYPARGIIRGRWEIGDYRVNEGIAAAFFRGPEIVQAPRAQQRAFAWEGAILDSLPPDVRAASDEDVRRVQDEARELVRAEALARARSTAPSARRISDFVRVNRVEGLAVGAGARQRFGGGVFAGARGRWGFDDHEAKGELSLGRRWASGAAVTVRAWRDHRDVGDVAEGSLLRNSIAAQEFGSDWTDPYDVRGAALGVDLAPIGGVRLAIEGAYEEHDRLAVHAEPSTGRYEPTIAAWPIDMIRVTLRAERSTTLGPFGSEIGGEAELRGGRFEGRDTTLAEGSPRLLRGSVALRVERPVGRHRLVLETTAAGVAARPAAPPQELVYVGGPVTGPGYDFHAFVGRAAATQRVEWRMPVPFVAVPLGRFGTAPATATLAPYAHVVWLEAPRGSSAPSEGVHPAVGVGVLTLFDLLRLDVARGLRNGRWMFSVDVGRDFWRVL